jgi:hypothetical protein
VVDTLLKVLRWVAKVGGVQLVQVFEVFQGCGGDHQDAESIEADGPKMKSGGTSQQSGLSRAMSRGKERKKFGPSYQHKGQAKGTTSNKGGTQGRKPRNVGNKEDNIVVMRQFMFVPWTKC